MNSWSEESIQLARRGAIGGAVLFALLASGCIHHEETVYKEEARKPVSFENDSAARKFYEAFLNQPQSHRQVSSTDVSVPVVFGHKVRTVEGSNAEFNRAVEQCDANRDGVITLDEATKFEAQLAQPKSKKKR